MIGLHISHGACLKIHVSILKFSLKMVMNGNQSIPTYVAIQTLIFLVISFGRLMMLNLRNSVHSQKIKLNISKICHDDFKFVYSKNKIKWIESDNKTQLNWIYQYLNKNYRSTFISEPKDNSQLYNTVICQLDLICENYSNELEEWTKFITTMKKAWSTQSTRLKKRNTEITLDKGSIKMLRSIAGEGATDTMLKKKLKEIIQKSYDVQKD